jgi:uncharacterized protein
MHGDPVSLSRILVAVTCLIGAVVSMGPIPAPAASVSGPDSALRIIPVLIGKRTIQARVAENDPARVEGLLGWNSISDDTGMLLDFGREGKFAIHMQGMKFPIDAVWIDNSGQIKLVYEDIQPDSGQIYPAMFPCRYCLELKSGFCKRFGVTTGSRVKLGDQNP